MTFDHNKWKREYENRHKEQGLCIQCNREATPGYIRCSFHRAKQRVYDKKYTEKYSDRRRKQSMEKKKKRIANNRCRDCGGPMNPDIDGGLKICFNCRCRIRQRQ